MAFGDLTQPGSSIQAEAQPGDNVVGIIHTVPLFNQINCIRLGELNGSNQRLRQARNYLWHGLIDDTILLLDELRKKPANNLQNYLLKHSARIPDYQIYQQLGICIGSGSVESWIKQIASRIKIIGSQWNQNNVSQMLKLRCTYLNGDIAVGIST